jgi:hypothetical protein
VPKSVTEKLTHESAGAFAPLVKAVTSSHTPTEYQQARQRYRDALRDHREAIICHTA